MASTTTALLVMAAALLLAGAALLVLARRRPAVKAARPQAAIAAPRNAATPARTGVRAATAQAHVVPLFEPQIELETGLIAGFRVDAHWPDAAAATGDAAERCSPGGEPTLSLMRQAFLAAHDWNAGLTLSFAIAPSLLRDPWLPQKIIKALVETGFPASRLEIEIDDASLDDLPLAPSIVASLRNQGVRVAVHWRDAGSPGRASVMFDGVTVAPGGPGASANRMTLSRMIAAAEAANRPVTAIDVASAEMALLVRTLGCTHARGSHYGDPAQAPQTRRLLAEKRLLCSAADRARTPFPLSLQAG